MSGPLFGYGGEERPRKGRSTIKRDQGGHERWADAILPADAEAGVIETPTNRRPLWLLVGLVLITTAALGFQLFQLQIVGGARNLSFADGNRLCETITRAPRGIIYDSSGNVLAQNLASFDVNVVPSLLPSDPAKRQQLYATVAGLLNMQPSQIAAASEGNCVQADEATKLSKTRAEAACLSNTEPQVVASNVPRDIALNFDQSTNTVPGFSLDDNPIRQYNNLGGTLSSILGYTGRVDAADLAANPNYSPTDYIGKLGLEKQYESVLRGQNGTTQTEVDATGKPIKVLASQPAEPGDNLVLTIDSGLQNYLTGAIQQQMQASGATQAAGVALDPRNGDLLAVVSLPGYDNNQFAGGISQSAYSKLVNDPTQPLFNKAISGAYPTGSIIKPLVASTGLQTGAITPSTTVDDTGSITVHNQYNPSITYTYESYTDYETGQGGPLGVVNVVKALAVSSDVFFYTVGGGFGNIAGVGVTRLESYYHKFGLGQYPKVDIPEQSAGRVPTPSWYQKNSGQPWTVGDTYNISIGQGDLLASPLQMAVAEAAVANGGTVYQPHFLKEVENPSGQVTQTFQPKIESQNFISPADISIVKQGMHDAVYASYGTACCKIAAQVPVEVGAKTGTAQTGTTAANKPDAWFTAFAPFDNPQIEIVVFVANAGEGATYAAPAVRETLTYCFTRPGGCVQ
ncbi:MAG TPA: penicillin-binding protein 2 [Candidatus Saccharimonadales bacterium]|nr:penicillin-binding protein 2 [Candidatus Saccharimonadales bacterium]